MCHTADINKVLLDKQDMVQEEIWLLALEERHALLFCGEALTLLTRCCVSFANIVHVNEDLCLRRRFSIF